MIDNFAVLLTHGLMLLVAWRLLLRPDLDAEDVPDKRRIDRPREAERRGLRRTPEDTMRA